VTFNYPLAAGTTASASVTELAAGNGFSISGLVCVDSDGGLGTTPDSTPQAPGTLGPTAVANMNEAEFVVCTFSNLQQVPTAAPASISGRATSAGGRGLAGAKLILTDLATGETRATVTDSLGNYIFTDVPTAELYMLTISSRKATFSDNTRTFTLNEDAFDMNFIAN